MKRHFVKIAFALLMLISVSLFFAACGLTTKSEVKKHEHSFNVKTVDEEHFASPATCQSPAKYYYSCECGEIGSSTFTDGEKLEHEPSIPIEENRIEASCTVKGSYDRVVKCSVCGDEISRVTYVLRKPHEAVDGECTSCGMKESSPGLLVVGNAGDGYTVRGIGKCKDTDIVIGLYYGSEITSIGAEAFKDSNLTSVTIEPCVTSIGLSAFEDSKKIESISLPDSVISIDEFAFSGCESLAYNEYENAYYLGNSENPYAALISAVSTDITSCKIHNNTKVISGYAFKECFVVSTNEYDGCDYIGTEDNPYLILLRVKISSIESCTVHPDTKIIASEAFRGSSIKSINLPEGLIHIGYNAFSLCNRLERVTIPDTVITVGTDAFAACEKLANVTLGKSVLNVGKYAFAFNAALNSVFIPRNVSNIYQDAFLGSKNVMLFCETYEAESGWYSSFHGTECSVIWGYKKS